MQFCCSGAQNLGNLLGNLSKSAFDDVFEVSERFQYRRWGLAARSIEIIIETALGPRALGPRTLGPGTLGPGTLGPGMNCARFD